MPGLELDPPDTQELSEQDHVFVNGFQFLSISPDASWSCQAALQATRGLVHTLVLKALDYFLDALEISGQKSIACRIPLLIVYLHDQGSTDFQHHPTMMLRK